MEWVSNLGESDTSAGVCVSFPQLGYGAVAWKGRSKGSGEPLEGLRRVGLLSAERPRVEAAE